MPEGVKCTVSNCTFWDEGNLCAADSIVVDIDKHAVSFDTEFASFEGEHQDMAVNASTTCCNTFKPRSENQRK